MLRVAVAAVLGAAAAATATSAAAQRPNFIFVITDDQDIVFNSTMVGNPRC